MREAIHVLRQKIKERLSGSVIVNSNIVPVYNRIPTDAEYPLIRVYSVGSQETDQNQTTFVNDYVTRVEAVTRFESDDGGELDCNLIMDQVLQLLRTRSKDYFDLSGDGFNIYTSTSLGVRYFTEDYSDRTYFRGVLELSNKIEQL